LDEFRNHALHGIAAPTTEHLLVEIEPVLDVVAKVRTRGEKNTVGVRKGPDVGGFARGDAKHTVSLPRVTVLPVATRTLVAMASSEEIEPRQLEVWRYGSRHEVRDFHPAVRVRICRNASHAEAAEPVLLGDEPLAQFSLGVRRETVVAGAGYLAVGEK
jgi:hypothetical protein